MPPSKPDNSKIHIAKKQLGLSDEVYRDILLIRYKKDSSAKLSAAQGRDLVSHFITLGFEVKRKSNSKSFYYPDPRARKVYMLWKTLEDAGVIRKRSRKALNTFVKRQTGIADLRWCKDHHDFTKLIKALKAMGMREDVDLE